MGERNDEHVSVRAGLDVSTRPKVAADQQAFTLGDLVLAIVIGHPVLQARVVHCDHVAVSGQVEVEQIASLQGRYGRSYEQVVLELRSQSAAVHEADAARRHFPLPAKLGIVICSAGNHEQARQSLLRRLGNVIGRPAQLLQGRRCCRIC